jgi:hypothetical protein
MLSIVTLFARRASMKGDGDLSRRGTRRPYRWCFPSQHAPSCGQRAGQHSVASGNTFDDPPMRVEAGREVVQDQRTIKNSC